jgi:hypothetical protein
MSKIVLIVIYSFCGTHDIHRVLVRYIGSGDTTPHTNLVFCHESGVSVDRLNGSWVLEALIVD